VSTEIFSFIPVADRRSSTSEIIKAEADHEQMQKHRDSKGLIENSTGSCGFELGVAPVLDLQSSSCTTTRTTSDTDSAAASATAEICEK